MMVIGLSCAVVGHPGAWQLGPIDLQVDRGSFWGLVGPNGAGKTTLLRTLAGLQPLIAGTCELSGGAEERGGISYVPQREALDPVFPVTALNVVCMGLAPRRVFGLPFSLGTRRKALAALDRVGLAHLASAPFRRLSGGEQQRVLLARALVADAVLMLLDEPTAAMDVDAEREILDLLHSLTQEERLAVIMVSHSLASVRQHAGRVVLMNREEGSIRVGTPTEILGDRKSGSWETFRQNGPTTEPNEVGS